MLVLLILDGVGLFKGRAEGYEGNAFDLAATPNLDRLFAAAPVFRELKAHGTAVGLPSDDDMGNSEVGHNAMGAGRVFEQGARLVKEAIADRSLFAAAAWRGLVDRVRERSSTLHFIGLLSDGNVHSHLDHLEALIRAAVADGVRRLRVHALADGRDVEPVSFERYLRRLQLVLDEVRGRGADAAVASGGGRMRITMDRYEADWGMVERGWRTHVRGEGRCFADPFEAVATLRRENPGIIDQDLPPFVIADAGGAPVGRIVDGDAVVFFNFRGDRAIEISRAFTEPALAAFERGPLPEVLFAGMMEYDGDLKIPPRYLVDPPAISRTVSEYLVRNGVSQLATAETQKFGHVTYFWNGNNSEPFDRALEAWVEVPSSDIPFDQQPEMKAREVAQVVIADLEARGHRFIRANLANGDMVGHTGSLGAAVRAMEVVDECVGRIEAAARAAGATLIVTADHGNLEMMLEVADLATGALKLDADGAPLVKTSHTLSPVPWCLTGVEATGFEADASIREPGLGNLAATLLLLLGYAAPDDYLPPLIQRAT
ncbi:MAG: 2,3-bisphosphoglycerate-independent phosphoglycerate mutase [Thermoanaerobaculales bacterium]|nr:2,3-bisphosphoglycerate-independent phosphoglycerate mutase [Thermoanaerobaculales bacterium]